MVDLASQLGPSARPEIIQAWHRAQVSGLDPGMAVRENVTSEINRRSRLMKAAGPVLDHLANDLADTRFSVLLADRTAKIVDRRLGQRSLDRVLERVLAVPGAMYQEEFSGTNSLSTAFELQAPIGVTGEEHFLEDLRGFACYGVPIFNTVTRRLEGVIDITGPAAEATNLLGPFLQRAARDIELRLLEGARTSERKLLATFQEHARNKRHAVLVLSETMVLLNPTAGDLFRDDDISLLRALAADLGPSAVTHHPIVLSSGHEVKVIARQVAGTDGVLFDAAAPIADRVQPVPVKSSQGSVQMTVAVVGEPGTGRTTSGLELAGATAHVLDCVSSTRDENQWLRMAISMLSDDERPVLLDNVHLLSGRVAATIAPSVRSTTKPVVMTSSPVPVDHGEHASLLATAQNRHDLRPLRMYGEDFPPLADHLLQSLGFGPELRIAPSAMQILAVQQWPGNIRELKAVLASVAQERRHGNITAAALPALLRAGGPPHKLTVLEIAERDAIVAVLQETRGNRAAAAAKLGIGRTTLYQRLRRYGLEM